MTVNGVGNPIDRAVRGHHWSNIWFYAASVTSYVMVYVALEVQDLSVSHIATELGASISKEMLCGTQNTIYFVVANIL